MRDYGQRFWMKAEAGDPRNCWLWRGEVNKGGYGLFQKRHAHRIAYELIIGPVPDGLVLDHLCRVRSCVNPRHLEPVTIAENVRRGARGRMVTHCLLGHPYTPENTRVHHGRRECRNCANARVARIKDAAYWRQYRERRAAVGRPVKHKVATR